MTKTVNAEDIAVEIHPEGNAKNVATWYCGDNELTIPFMPVSDSITEGKTFLIEGVEYLVHNRSDGGIGILTRNEQGELSTALRFKMPIESELAKHLFIKGRSLHEIITASLN